MVRPDDAPLRLDAKILQQRHGAGEQVGETEADPLNSTHWNFASQLAVRVRLPDNGSDIELSVRHWSNGGIRLPNRGQDFATFSYGYVF